MRSVGVSNDDFILVKAKNWLLAKQNIDGGFGESTLSYSKTEWHGKGISTPTQTAWGLLALLKLLPANDPAILKAVDFLRENFKKNKTFIDESVTGTGHPNVCYMVYPSYAKAFTLMALNRYSQEIMLLK